MVGVGELEALHGWHLRIGLVDSIGFIMNRAGQSRIPALCKLGPVLSRINCSRSCWKHDPGDMAQGRRSSLF